MVFHFLPEVTDVLSRFVPRIIPFYLLLLAAGGTANAQSTFEQKAANPFDNNNDGLPDLDLAPENHDGEKHFAEIVKDFGETSMNDNGLDTGEQAKAFALGKVRDALSQQVNQHVESWLSAWGNASVDVKVDNEGHFTGSRGSWFVPLQDNDRYLTWSQLGLTQQDDGLVSNVGVGQRWARGSWLVGYNTFMTTCWTKIFSERASVPKRGANICDYRQTFISRLLHGMNRQPRRNNGWRAGTT
ncbi:hypothetical protein ECZU06_08610 [Escherichia coli]|nr:hypothetical protein ECZU06_08610 [Escherichia coli]GHL28618.1 hypothetical protein ECZU25_54310 [Escherichia coli]